MKTKSREIYENVVVSLLWCLCFLVGILPRCIRYGVLAPFVAFVLRKCVRYRYVVINNQLRDSYPDKSETEIAEICKGDIYDWGKDTATASRPVHEYKEGAKINRGEYRNKFGELVEWQVRKAGYRLAKIFNDIFE